MSKVQTLRVFINQRLSAAAEEIFELFERTIAEYEEELQHQRKLPDAVFQPEVRLHRSDVQQLLVIKEQVPPEQLDFSPSLDEGDPPELPQIKEEQEELRTSQEVERLHCSEEAEITNSTFTPVTVKHEGIEEEKQISSQLHKTQTIGKRDEEQLKTEADEEDCGGPKPVWNCNPDTDLHSDTNAKTSDSCEVETDNSCDWEETREPQSGLNPLQNNEEPVSDNKCTTGKPSVSSSDCVTFDQKTHLQKHSGPQTKVKPFSCSVCGKAYRWQNSLTNHERLHSEGKRFSCSVCEKTFQWRFQLVRHMMSHTGEERLSCPVCGKGFAQNGTLKSHLRIHTGEKPYKCTVCGKTFRDQSNLRQHSFVHTGEKRFGCSVCGKTFSLKHTLTQHLLVHTGEKPFSCSVCGKAFSQKQNLRQHSFVHTGEKRFSCSVCGKTYSQKQTLKQHSTVHTGEKPFSCSVCGKTFSRKHQLSQHSNLHTRRETI